MPAPRFLGYQALLGEPKPINWQGVGQALWDSNLNAPIRGAYNLMNADPYTLYTDTGAAGQQAATDSFDAAGGVTVGSMPIPKPSNALAMGIKAYHGSPHSFDKFSMDKIGTGEGAQAYGHGLYFAENEGVARGYRDALKPGKGMGPEDTASRVLDGHGGDRDAAIASLTDTIDRAFANNSPYKEVQRLMQAKNILNTAPEKAAGSMYEVNIDADPNAFLDWDKPLSEQPEVFNKLYGAQEARRKELLSSIPQMDGTIPYDEYMARYGSVLDEAAKLRVQDNISGQDLVQRFGANPQVQIPGVGVTHARGSENAVAAQRLKEAGIPGIKYLDAGSRVPSAMAKKELSEWQAQLPLAEKELADATARGDQWLISRKQAEVQRVKDGIARVSKEADGTRNYVVFDDKLISIVKKYGIAGASAMLGYDVLTGANEAQAKAFNKADLDHRYDNFLKSGGI